MSNFLFVFVVDDPNMFAGGCCFGCISGDDARSIHFLFFDEFYFWCNADLFDFWFALIEIHLFALSLGIHLLITIMNFFILIKRLFR